MRERNGFVFVETIVVIVVLTSSLLLLYSTFSKVLQSEKTRTYYDDISYVYRTWYLRKVIKDNNILLITNELATTDKYFVTVGPNYSNLFDNNTTKAYFSAIYSDFDVKQMVFVKTNKLSYIKQCTEDDTSDVCNQLYTNLSDDFITYLNSLYIDVDCAYFMAVEYETCNSKGVCHNYYSWVSVS